MTPATATSSARCSVKGRRVCRLCHNKTKNTSYRARNPTTAKGTKRRKRRSLRGSAPNLGCLTVGCTCSNPECSHDYVHKVRANEGSTLQGRLCKPCVAASSRRSRARSRAMTAKTKKQTIEDVMTSASSSSPSSSSSVSTRTTRTGGVRPAGDELMRSLQYRSPVGELSTSTIINGANHATKGYTILNAQLTPSSVAAVFDVHVDWSKGHELFNGGNDGTSSGPQHHRPGHAKGAACRRSQGLQVGGTGTAGTSLAQKMQLTGQGGKSNKTASPGQQLPMLQNILYGAVQDMFGIQRVGDDTRHLTGMGFLHSDPRLARQGHHRDKDIDQLRSHVHNIANWADDSIIYAGPQGTHVHLFEGTHLPECLHANQRVDVRDEKLFLTGDGLPNDGIQETIVHLAPGEILVFSSFLVHCGGANNSESGNTRGFAHFARQGLDGLTGDRSIIDNVHYEAGLYPCTHK